jgi:integrase
MTLAESTALLTAAQAPGPRICPYAVLSLCTGIRTEEARALRWDHVDLGNPGSEPARIPSVAVSRSVRAKGDTKTTRSRRTLASCPRSAGIPNRWHRFSGNSRPAKLIELLLGKLTPRPAVSSSSVQQSNVKAGRDRRLRTTH